MVYAYTITHSNRTERNNNYIPGPGTYDSSSFVKHYSPNWKIGTSQRTDWEKNQNPGPGSYNAQLSFDSKKNKGPAYVFGVKTQYVQQQQYVPGPGAYNQNYNFYKNPAYSLRPKYSDQSQDNKTPGPGHYDTNISTVKNKKSSKIGKSKRDQYYIRNFNPGPGQYTQIEYKPTLPSYGFGTEERINNFKAQKNENIGPGTYELKSTIRTDIGNSISPRINHDQNDKEMQMIGPGTYNPTKNKVLKKSPAFKIGKQKRGDNSSTNNIPGPGNYSPSYNYIRSQSPNYKIGSANRQDLYNKAYSPGPGQYNDSENYQKQVKGPQYTMVPRRIDFSQKEQQNIPGPDKYKININLTKSRISTHKIGTGNRPNTSQSNKNNPGPGNYQIPYSIGKQGQGFCFGKEERIKSPKQCDLPGPGQYDIKHFTEDIPSYAINRDTLKIKM